MLRAYSTFKRMRVEYLMSLGVRKSAALFGEDICQQEYKGYIVLMAKQFLGECPYTGSPRIHLVVERPMGASLSLDDSEIFKPEEPRIIEYDARRDQVLNFGDALKW